MSALWAIVVGFSLIAFVVLWIWALQFSTMFDDSPDPYEEHPYDGEALPHFLEEHIKAIAQNLKENSPLDKEKESK